MKKLALYFVVGFLWDGIVTLDVVCVAKGWVAFTGVTTWVLTYLSFTMYDRLVSREGMDRLGVQALAIGSSLGAMLGTYWAIGQ